MRRLLFLSGIVLQIFASIAACADQPWTNVINKTNTRKATIGRWQVKDGELQTNAAAGSRIELPIQPTGEYDFRVTFTRHSGEHSIALMFVAGRGQASFEIDAWGQHLAGIQAIGGRDAKTNSTKVENQTLQNGRKYTAELRVRRDRVEAYLDNKLLTTYRGNGSDLSMLNVWRLGNTRSLGVGAWESATTFHSIEVRPVSGNLGTPPVIASNNPKSRPSTGGNRPTTPRPTRPGTTRPSTRTSRPMPNSTGNSNPTRTAPRPTNGEKGRVLIVIANDGFFYREYAHPREELEKAGFVVEVAAGFNRPCQPHANSGQGNSNGVVRPDLTLSQVDAKRYRAILFSGGWGSSMYQYAFRGSYDNRAYNGTRQIKETANRLINTFVEQDKFVCGLCHGVSVLAWSRVNGRSLLRGRRATGATTKGPSGIYNGQRAQPPSRWNAETNGARMVAPNSVGNRSTAADDVVIDGKVMTGQDDISAREMGRQMAIQLSR